MKKLIEVIEIVIENSKMDKSEYIVPKWAMRKLIRALKSNRKDSKKKGKKHEQEEEE